MSIICWILIFFAAIGAVTVGLFLYDVVYWTWWDRKYTRRR